MGETWSDGSAQMNLRVRLDIWPPGQRLPRDATEAGLAAVKSFWSATRRDDAPAVRMVRFAEDGVSDWQMDAIVGVDLNDMVRAVATAFEPHAYGVVVVQPMRAPGDPTVRGVAALSAWREALVSLQGEVQGLDGPLEARSVGRWTRREAQIHDDRARLIGVPPSVEVRLPLLGAGEA